jgi:hypothetical protein
MRQRYSPPPPLASTLAQHRQASRFRHPIQLRSLVGDLTRAFSLDRRARRCRLPYRARELDSYRGAHAVPHLARGSQPPPESGCPGMPATWLGPARCTIVAKMFRLRSLQLPQRYEARSLCTEARLGSTEQYREMTTSYHSPLFG